jgi:lactoylglutathione lyase
VRLHHANFRTVRPAEMVGFYRSVGLTLVGCCDLGGPSTLYLGDPEGGATLELTYRPDGDAEWLGAPGTGHVAFQVDELDAEIARLRDLGIECGDGVRPGGRSDVYVAFLHDPDGNHVELVQSPFPSVRDPLPAGLTWED